MSRKILIAIISTMVVVSAYGADISTESAQSKRNHLQNLELERQFRPAAFKLKERRPSVVERSVVEDSLDHIVANPSIDFTEGTNFDAAALDSIKNLTPDEIKTERLKAQQRVIYFGDEPLASSDSLKYIITRFYIDQYRHFQDPLAPYFLMMSRDAKLALGIGGVVRMRGWYDFDGSVPVNGFVPYMISVPSNPAQRRRFSGTPGGTGLFFQLIGRNKTLGDISGYIQCDFSGDNNVTFTLKKAYVTISDWTVGYATTTFSDPQTEVPTIDGAGQNSKISGTHMLIRYTHNFKQKWQVAGSVEMPHSATDVDGVNTAQLSDWMPDYAAYVQYQWARGGHLRLAGVLRTMPYRDLVKQQNKSIVGWGAQLSTRFNPTRMLTIYGSASTGHGYSDCIGDLGVGQYDLVGDPTVAGKMYAPMAMAGSVGLKYNFANNVYACAVFGQVRYLPRNGVAPTEYKYGQYGAVNVFWDMTTRLQIGAEYLIGRRANFNHEHASANRVDVLFQFSF